MTLALLVQRSLAHYWRTNLGVVLGAALGTMVLTGSLMVGDSVQAILRRQGEERVGNIQSALVAGDRTFRAALAGEVGGGTVPVLMLRGSVARTDAKARVNQAQVLGITPAFLSLARGADSRDLPGAFALLNASLARQLHVGKGDTLIVRVEKPTAFSRDAPLSGEENETVALRVTVAEILHPREFGNFSLQANQLPPLNLYLPLAFLQERLGVKEGANLLLSRQFAAGALEAAVREHWQLGDAGLELRALPNGGGGVTLRSPRVFLDPPVTSAVPFGTPALTYLVNEIRAGQSATPYSMATAVDTQRAGLLPQPLGEHEAALSQWEADDLGVTAGGRITLKYYVMGERRKLDERSADFTVRAVLPMETPGLNTSWMPDFPGLSDKQNCRDWNPGFALENNRLRDRDEAYWKQYRGTPKVIIGLAEGRRLWGNRWGDTTTVSFAEPPPAANLLARITPAQLGMAFLPLREQAMAATHPPFGFGELFIGFSFFLLAAAAGLTGLLFVFAMEQRNEEAGLLLALGWTPRRVRCRFLREGAVLAARGSVFGVLAALLYTPLVLLALTTVWHGAAQGIGFYFRPNYRTLLLGGGSGMLLALGAMWVASRRQLRRTAADLLTATGGLESSAGPAGKPWSLYLGSAAMLAAVAVVIAQVLPLPVACFTGGSLLLAAMILFAHFLLGVQGRLSFGRPLSLARLGLLNASRRRGRSTATVAVLASGVFMVVAVDAFRQHSGEGTHAQLDGTGGFALLGESALPVYVDLNTKEGRESFALDEKIVAGASVVPFRVKEGDDASCLNLNQALQPRLLGVRPESLARRGAFRFAEKAGSWRLLDQTGDRTVPGIVDATTLEWALKKKVNDVVEYRDERGQPLLVRLVASLSGSVLQGSIIISESAFVEHYPSSGGYRYFLIDAPPTEGQGAAVAPEFSRALADRGLEVIPAARRLAQLQEVENTYLAIFQALGGLGLLLGSAGLAIVVGRNVLERRGEFGLLEAVGFRRGQLRRLVLSEHLGLVGYALVQGFVCALLGATTNLLQQAGGFSFRGMAALFLALALGASFWTWLATRLALRREQLGALRSE